MRSRLRTEPTGLSVLESRRCLEADRAQLVGLVLTGAYLILLTPETRIKVLLATHLHEDAAAVARLTGRLAELGVEQEPAFTTSWPPELPARLGTLTNTASRLDFLYRTLKAALAARVHDQVASFDPILDAPTVQLTRRIEQTLRDQIAEAGGNETIGGEDGRTLPASFDRHGVPVLPGLPARESRLRVSDTWVPRPTGDKADVAHFEMMSLEIPTIESCARNILAFPDMPWDFVADMSRQCWDEARHAAGYLRQLEEHGGSLGRLPVDHKLWRMTTGLPLDVALAAHQRLGESIGVNGAITFAEEHARKGDVRSAQLYDFVARDEITHVAIGNKWLGHLIRRSGVDLGSVVATATQRRAEFDFKSVSVFPPRPWALLRAGFTPEDIAAMRQFAAESVTGGSG